MATTDDLRAYAQDADNNANKWVPMAPATLRAIADDLDALRKDAERYRMLRDSGYLDHLCGRLHPCDEPRRLGLTDAQVDRYAAMHCCRSMKMDEGKGPNPHYAGHHHGESDELRTLRLALVKKCKELRDTLTTVYDALDYLHGMTPQQAADVRKDAAAGRRRAQGRRALPLAAGQR